MSIILNSLNKLFVIIALIFAPSANAIDSNSISSSTSHDIVLQKIHTIVETKLSGSPITSFDALVPTLESLKAEALAVIAAEENKTAETTQLENAFKKLNPKSIADILKATAEIIKLVDEKTRALILGQLPASIKIMLATKSK